MPEVIKARWDPVEVEATRWATETFEATDVVDAFTRLRDRLYSAPPAE
jgi:hypothetical protein